MKIISFLYFISVGLITLSQNSLTDSIPSLSRKANTVYAEGFGSGIFYSVNYDRLLTPQNRFPISASIGAMVIPSRNGIEASTPIALQGLIGKNNHFFEIGLAIVPDFDAYSYTRKGQYEQQDKEGNYYKIPSNITDKYKIFYLNLTPKIGYRYQRANGGIFLRVTFTPFIGLVNELAHTSKAENGYMVNEYKESKPFTSPFWDAPYFPWGGFSVGWTF